MKKFILLLTCFCCLTTSVFADLNFSPSLSAGFKTDNLSTGIEVYANDKKSYNLIKWAGLKNKPSAAIDFDLEWYNNDNPIYFGLTTGLSAGGVFSFAENFKLGYYNNYINLFCKIGASAFAAKMTASESVKMGDKNNYNYYEIETITFYDVGFSLGIGLDLHPTKGPFFVRLSYNHEIYNPDWEIKTTKFTKKYKSLEWSGDTDFHNRSFTIAIGWQFRRKNIVKEDTLEDKNSPENVRQISFNYVDNTLITDSNLLLMVSDSLTEKGIRVIGKPFFTNEEKLDKIEDTLM